MVNEEEQTKNIGVSSPYKQLTGNKLLARLAISLGLLLVLGGILLGITETGDDIAALPSFTPSFTTSATSSPTAQSAEPTSSPTFATSQSPSPSQAPSQTAPQNKNKPNSDVAFAPAVKGYRVGDRPNETGVVQDIPETSGAPSSSPLPLYSPIEALPEYSPATALPAYEPQFTSPTPTPIHPLRQLADDESTQNQSVSVTLKIINQSYVLEVRPASTVLEVFESAKSQGLTYKSQSYSGLGERILEINGQGESGNRYWTYTINGEFAKKGVSTQTVSEGDKIVWTLSN